MANDENVGHSIVDLFDSDPVVDHFLDQFEALIQLASARIEVGDETEHAIVSKLNRLSREVRFAIVEVGVDSISRNERSRVLNAFEMVEKLSARFPAEDMSSSPRLSRKIVYRVTCRVTRFIAANSIASPSGNLLQSTKGASPKSALCAHFSRFLDALTKMPFLMRQIPGFHLALRARR
jgi:hypothetical protein